jgi:transcriptional regulator with XRE-family HTH domain
MRLRLSEADIRYHALINAIKVAGNVALLAKKIGATRQQISNWKNRDPHHIIPYQFAVKIEDYANISIERLAPQEVEANKIIRRLKQQSKDFIVKLPIQDVSLSHIYSRDTDGSQLIHNYRTQKLIVVDANYQLLSGSAYYYHQQHSGQIYIDAAIIDLDSLWLGLRSIKDYEAILTISSRVEIASALQYQIGSRQGKRTDRLTLAHKSKNNFQEPNIWDATPGRTDEIVAKLVGLGSKNTYLRAKNVLKSGYVEIIDAMDQEVITISHAEKLVKLPEDKRQQAIQKLRSGS